MSAKLILQPKGFRKQFRRSRQCIGGRFRDPPVGRRKIQGTHCHDGICAGRLETRQTERDACLKRVPHDRCEIGFRAVADIRDEPGRLFRPDDVQEPVVDRRIRRRAHPRGHGAAQRDLFAPDGPFQVMQGPGFRGRRRWRAANRSSMVDCLFVVHEPFTFPQSGENEGHPCSGRGGNMRKRNPDRTMCCPASRYQMRQRRHRIADDAFRPAFSLDLSKLQVIFPVRSAERRLFRAALFSEARPRFRSKFQS